MEDEEQYLPSAKVICFRKKTETFWNKSLKLLDDHPFTLCPNMEFQNFISNIFPLDIPLCCTESYNLIFNKNANPVFFSKTVRHLGFVYFIFFWTFNQEKFTSYSSSVEAYSSPSTESSTVWITAVHVFLMFSTIFCPHIYTLAINIVYSSPILSAQPHLVLATLVCFVFLSFSHQVYLQMHSFRLLLTLTW